MNHTMARATIAAVLLGLIAGSATGDTPQASINSADEQAIRKIVLDRIESFNRHEAPAPGFFTADADFVNVYGMWRKGPAEIEQGQGERMRTVLKDARVTLRDLRIRFVRPDVAIVHQRHEMSGMLSPSGEKMPPHEEVGIRVMVKEQGTWLVTAFHNTIVRPEQPRRIQ
jgi:uncharacterized protein (TIGR02246 family)